MINSWKMARRWASEISSAPDAGGWTEAGKSATDDRDIVVVNRQVFDVFFFE